MKTRRLLAIAGSLLVLVIIACMALLPNWQRQQPMLKDTTKLLAAVQAFSRDRGAAGRAVPSSVSLRELIRSGYVAASDVQGFEAMRITICRVVDESQPQDYRIGIGLPDGRVISQLVDGGIQEIRR